MQLCFAFLIGYTVNALLPTVRLFAVIEARADVFYQKLNNC